MRTQALVLSVFLLAAGAGGAAAQSNRPLPPPPATWERIPLHHIDVRVLTAAFGGQNLPTEWDLYRMRLSGGYGMMGGGGYPVFGGRLLGDPSSNSLLMGPGGTADYGVGMGPRGAGGMGLGGGRFLLGDPNSNSLILGPRMPQVQR